MAKNWFIYWSLYLHLSGYCGLSFFKNPASISFFCFLFPSLVQLSDLCPVQLINANKSSGNFSLRKNPPTVLPGNGRSDVSESVLD